MTDVMHGILSFRSQSRHDAWRESDRFSMLIDHGQVRFFGSNHNGKKEDREIDMSSSTTTIFQMTIIIDM